MIRNCPTCKPHDYQDSVYGKNMRVYTKGNKPEHVSRCTVCEKEHKAVVGTKK